ncbi:MAG: PBS lyase [Deltaproteobacteria bacterium HGW-Deltaproteobacteria-11]|nr:MAG: PBS lyase [Deltaproteobacteria bacterium HGW-Deltaproteobacteria-11]
MSLTEEIKSYALDLGYSRVGITTAEPFPMYAQALEERSQDYDWAVESGLRLERTVNPQDRLPGARSIVVAVYDYVRERFPENLVGKIGRLYQTRSYIEPPTRLGGARVQLMRQFLEKNGMKVGRWFLISSGVPDRLAAVRAGVGEFGRNTFVCSPGIGTFVIIHTFIVDAELEYDAPAKRTHCPPACRLCIEACPTGAIVADFRLNPRRCITFNHVVNVHGFRNTSPYIDPELRPKMASWIHGCDVCQEACPRNQAKLKAELPVSAFLEETAKHFSLTSLLRMDREIEQKAVAPLLHTYMQERKYFQRNAAVALGNSGDPEVAPHLARAMEDPEELVRAHAAWALGQLGGAEARRSLEASLTREGGARAKEEIKAALETI